MAWGNGGAGDRPARTALAVCAVLTVVVLTVRDVTFGVQDERLHLVTDTVDGASALVVLGLLAVRRRRTHLAQDDLLRDAVACLVAASLVLSVGGSLAGVGSAHAWVWTEVLLRATGSVLFLAAAVPSVGLRPRAGTAWVRRAVAAAVVLAPLLLAGAGVALPDPVPGLPDDPSTPDFEGHPVLLVLQVASAVVVLAAAWLLARQARADRDPFVSWAAAAMVVLGTGRIHYALYPSIYDDWIYTGDAFRTGGYLLLLVGAVLEVRRYYADRTRDAVAEERRRIARELHDGVAQELSLIRMEARPLVRAAADEAAAGGAGEILAAVDRAEVETRVAIDALTADPGAPLGREVVRVASETARRLGAVVREDGVDDVSTVPPEVRHQVLRVVREAVLNGVRHGACTRVDVSVRHDAVRWTVRVADDGSGFDVDAASGGFGLTAMRQRAEALGGRLDVASTPGEGTEVVLSW